MVDFAVRSACLSHVGLVVADLETTGSDFERRWGAELRDVVELTYVDATYSGCPAEITVLQGFIRSDCADCSDIELIEPVSVFCHFTDFLIQRRGDGLHHLSYSISSIDEHLARLRPTRSEVLLDAHLPDGRSRIVHIAGFAHGPIIELIQRNETESGVND